MTLSVVYPGAVVTETPSNPPASDVDDMLIHHVTRTIAVVLLSLLVR